MEIALTKLVAAFVLPPGINLVIGFAGVLALRRARRLGQGLIVAALGSLYLLSAPFLAWPLIGTLERYPALPVGQVAGPGVGAIVVLGGGMVEDAPEYGRDALSEGNLPRLRYAARLERRTGLPLLVTGGRVHGEGVTEAALMRALLEEELHVPVTWVEDRSRNTAENARYSAVLLERAGIDRVFVVTHASHMTRAVDAFGRAGIAAIPAPVEFMGGQRELTGREWLPQVWALDLSVIALHEYVGRLWYRVRY